MKVLQVGLSFNPGGIEFCDDIIPADEKDGSTV